MTEQELQGIEERFKHLTKHITDYKAIVLGSDFGKLIAEVRRLNDVVKGAAVMSNYASEKIRELNNELEQHKTKETYLLARLKKEEG